MFYWSMKSVPELQRRSATERRQAAWQLGLKPLFQWQVWAALFFTGFLMLWGLETLTGNLFTHARNGGGRGWIAVWAVGALVIVYLSRLAYRHAYIKAMRPHIRRVSFDLSESWASARIKGAIMSLVSACLMVGSMLAIDWVINGYDADPDSRLFALRNWPERIPDGDNGFFTAAGLMAASGASAPEAGAHWVAAVDEEVSRHTRHYPAPPHGLRYVAYAPPPGADVAAAGPGHGFCEPGESCWQAWRDHKADVEAWLAANPELLARYQALQQYPQWQFAIMTDDADTPLPAYDGLLRAQGLYLAAALREMSKGLSGKQAPAKWQMELFGKGLDMIGNDIAFVRTMLAGSDVVDGKMAAASMLARDMALVAETARAYPRDVRAHWAKIGKMFDPLAAEQVSVADGFRFEEKVASSRGQEGYARLVARAPRVIRPWLARHYKKDATAAVMTAYWENVVRLATVSDSGRTLPLGGKNVLAPPRLSRWTGYIHNQGGNLILLEFRPAYREYINRMFDLNAMNALLRVRAEVALRNIRPNDMPAFLAEGDKTLLNPETGKPFEWDAERKQIYFIPATDAFKEGYLPESGVAGRIGLGI